MTDPVRLVHGEGTAFERELLNSVLDEPVPPALHKQMAAGIGLMPLALVPDAGFGAVGKAQASSGLSLLKVAAVSLGLAGVGVGVGFGVWSAQQDEPKASAAQQATVLTQPAVELQPRAVGRADDTRQQQDGVGALGETQQVRLGAESRTAELTQPRPARSETQPSAPSRSRRATRASDLGHEFIEKELRLLDPARAAIARGDSAQALRLLDDYDRRFPDGSLQREAKVLRSSVNSK